MLQRFGEITDRGTCLGAVTIRFFCFLAKRSLYIRIFNETITEHEEDL